MLEPVPKGGARHVVLRGGACPISAPLAIFRVLDDDHNAGAVLDA